MAVEQIKKAKNNKERQETYRVQLGRYKRAINNGFYFEALIIVYSLIEDRLKSFLYYCGYFANRNTIKLNDKVRYVVVSIVYGDNVPSKISFGNITTKIKHIRELLKWVDSITSDEIIDDIYLQALKCQLESLDIGGILDVLEELDNRDSGWLTYRNEIIHAAMNKNIEALYENLAEYVNKGMEIARFIDSQVRVIKSKGQVRKKIGMQNN